MASLKTDTEDTRSRILEAALDLFSTKGFHATTTRQIAQKAEVNEVTLFRQFKNKLTLFQEVLKEIENVGIHTEPFKGMDIDPLHAIRFTTETLFEIVENYPREIRLLSLATYGEVDGFEEDFVSKSIDYTIHFISDCFKKLKDQKIIQTNEPPELLAHMLLCQSLELARQKYILKYSSLKRYDRNSLCDSIVKLFLR